MKSFVKISLVALFTIAAVSDVDAQRTRRARGGGGTNPPATTTGGEAGQTESQQNNVNRQPSGYNPYGNIPIETAPPPEGEDTSGVKKSLRPDAAFDKSFINDRTPLPYEHLRWDDALYAEKVWREIDLREKMNQPFRYKTKDDNGDQRFISILLKAVQNGDVTAFSNLDDRFTTPLNPTEVQQLTAGGAPDTLPQYDIDDPSKVVKYLVTPKTFDPERVTKLRIKEEWVFDREASRMFVRILGIAPLKSSINEETGKENPGRESVMFWVYYPDLRPTLAKYEVYNSKNLGMGRMTWEELFESRMFSSYIVKSTLDNPFNQTIKQKIKDPILGLLEGDNIKERIFNYEQDLWSY
jgi:gliding motility associated protien GldN